jgi:hypothetical protein
MRVGLHYHFSVFSFFLLKLILFVLEKIARPLQETGIYKIDECAF